MSRLARGDLLPEVVVAPPGPASRALGARLARAEAPVVNTVGSRPAIAWLEARGANVLDVDGNRYLDFTSGFGVAAVGHRHPAVMRRLRRQSRLLVHGLGDLQGHPERVALAERLASLAPMPDACAYFAISGSDAVEIALKTALLATGRPGFVSFSGAYHGLTLGALAASGRPELREPFGAWIHPHAHHLPFGVDPDELDTLLAARPEIGAVLLEPIQGRAGVVVPPGGWLEAVGRVARGRGCLLLADEILTGFGRCGELFLSAAEGARPDLVCCGKALGGGLPLAAVLGSRSLLAAWDRGPEALHTATFLAHPLACATAAATIDLLLEEALPSRAAALGTLVEERTSGWVGTHQDLVDIRGRGLLWGFESARDGGGVDWCDRAAALGLLALPSGPAGRVLEILPPLTVTAAQLEAGLELLGEVLAAPA